MSSARVYVPSLTNTTAAGCWAKNHAYLRTRKYSQRLAPSGRGIESSLLLPFLEPTIGGARLRADALGFGAFSGFRFWGQAHNGLSRKL